MAKSASASRVPLRATEELDLLHTALDARLAALEAALANPSEWRSLEGLILDLARTATEEAEAVTRRCSIQARAEAEKQAGASVTHAQETDAALQAERQAGLELHRSLGAARSELEATKLKVGVLTNDLEQTRDAFAIERTTLRTELSEAERCFAAADTLRQQAEEARNEEVARERTTIQRLNEALAQARSEIDAARQEVASRSADVEAARERADVATRTQGELTQAVNEARGRVDAVANERDQIKAELESVRQGIGAANASLQSIEAQRAAIERSWHEAEARATAATRERDAVAAERDAVKGQLANVEQTARDADARGQVSIRERDAAIAEREVARSERDAVKSERDALRLDRDAARSERDAAVAQRESSAAEREAMHAQLDAARQGSSSATAAIQSLDAHRATIEQNWQNAEARAQTMARERDAAIAQRDQAVADRTAALANVDALRRSVDEAQEKERARFSELRERTERQIQNLEKQLIGSPADITSPLSAAGLDEDAEIDVSLDDDDDDGAIEIDAPPLRVKGQPAVTEAFRAAQAASNIIEPTPTRMASRHVFRDPIEVKLDGETAMLADISTAGAQVLSNGALKPNKQVKILLPSSDAIILCKARIVWSRFEPPTPGKPVRYRAGMAFTQADTAALQVFITRHTGVKMTAAPAEERKTGRVIPAGFGSRSEDSARRSREPISSIDFNFPAQRD